MVYSGTQKCLACPPGLAPVTVGPQAVEMIKNRKQKVQSWYLDLTMIMRYWGQERFYHHTAPINMIYGLNEALRIIAEEGLENRWQRHKRNAEALWGGLEALGVKLLVDKGYRLPSTDCQVLLQSSFQRVWMRWSSGRISCPNILSRLVPVWANLKERFYVLVLWEAVRTKKT